MKNTSLILCAIASAQIFFSSCTKENNLAASGSTNISYQLKTGTNSATLGRGLSGNISWTSGSVSASLIKFEAKSAGNAEVEYKTKTAQKVDLFNATTTKIGNVSLPVGTYNEVEFKIVLNKVSGTHSLELNGQFTSGGVSVPVSFVVDTELEIKAEKNNVVVTNELFKSLSTLDLSLLTSGVSEVMMAGAQKTGGTVVISASSNTAIYTKLLTNLSDLDSCEFEHD